MRPSSVSPTMTVSPSLGTGGLRPRSLPGRRRNRATDRARSSRSVAAECASAFRRARTCASLRRMKIRPPALAFLAALLGTPASAETNPSASLQTPANDAAAIWSKCVEERVDAMTRRAPRDVAPLDIAGTVLVLCSREEFLFSQALARTMDVRAARVRIAQSSGSISSRSPPPTWSTCGSTERRCRRPASRRCCASSSHRPRPGSARRTRKEETAMDIQRCGTVPTRRVPAEYFTGTVRQDPDHRGGGAGARAGRAGELRAGRADCLAYAPARTDADRRLRLRPRAKLGRPGARRSGAGDTVWFAPGEKHWRGAAPSVAMAHFAVQEALGGKARGLAGEGDGRAEYSVKPRRASGPAQWPAWLDYRVETSFR